MPERPDQTEEAEVTAAQQRAATAVERGVAEVTTPAEAARALDSLEKTAGDRREEEVAQDQPEASPQQQAAAIEEAAKVPADAKPASVIATAAVQSANALLEKRLVVDEAVTQALGGVAETNAPPEATRRGRRLLRHELFRRLRPLQAVDAFAFVQINQLPHTRQTDRIMSGLSWVMTGGAGWLVVLLGAMLADRRRGWHAARVVVPALWLATATVEYPIKKWFRRRRPFFSVVQAIIVGRKPGSYSFPSGHSAAAFAGAMLLAKQYPGGARGFFGLASLVAFSRVYLGAHYPGDVVSGSLLGMVLARIYSRALRKIGIAPM
jgi:undecaprenyl-diphosphatase